MAVQYDPKVIQEFAEKLYKEADSVVMAAAIRWGLIFCLIGGVLGLFLAKETSTGIIGAVLGAVAGGFLGSATAGTQAFLLRLQAQQALCQVKIEQNTRRGEPAQP